MIDAIRSVLVRDVRAVARQVEAYPDDDLLWRTVPATPNTGGTLALHLAGNLQHYVGAVLGGSGYIRDRDAEFAERGLGRDEVTRELRAAAEAVDAALASLTDDRLQELYPERVGGHAVRTADFLVHLVAHTAYHLGQLDYHRRTVTGETVGIGAISIRELPSAAGPAMGG